MESQWCTQDAWQKGVAGRKWLGVPSESAEGSKTQNRLQSQTQKLRWVTPQHLEHLTTRGSPSFSSAGHTFPDLAMNMNNACFSVCVVSVMDKHCNISTCYLQSLPV